MDEDWLNNCCLRSRYQYFNYIPSRAGTAYPSRAHVLIPSFQWVRVALVFCVLLCRDTIVYILLLVIVSSVF